MILLPYHDDGRKKPQAYPQVCEQGLKKFSLSLWKALLLGLLCIWSCSQDSSIASKALKSHSSDHMQSIPHLINEKSSVPFIMPLPIRFDEERIALTITYRQLHQDPQIHDIFIEPKVIVIHHTMTHSLFLTWSYFNKPRLNKERVEIIQGGEVNVSTHFLVDRDGTIYQLMPETWMARHCIGLNHVAIGIENIGDLDAFPLTDAQLKANVALIRYLAHKYSITHVIGHYEAEKLVEHAYFHELDANYRTEKSDPDPQFMTQIRHQIADLKLADPLSFSSSPL